MLVGSCLSMWGASLRACDDSVAAYDTVYLVDKYLRVLGWAQHFARMRANTSGNLQQSRPRRECLSPQPARQNKIK